MNDKFNLKTTSYDDKTNHRVKNMLVGETEYYE